MKRRGFIGRVAALVAAPLAARKAVDEGIVRGFDLGAGESFSAWYVKPLYPHQDHAVDAMSLALRDVYPDGCFRKPLDEVSPFLKRLKEGS